MTEKASARNPFLEVLLVFLRLGPTSFGGPVAHLGYFREGFVERRRWLGEKSYADLVALGQFLPGPASSQVGFALGVLRAGPSGGAAAWIGFTLPSAVIMVLAAHSVSALAGGAGAGLLHGLKLVAVGVVAQRSGEWPTASARTGRAPRLPSSRPSSCSSCLPP